MTIRLPLALLLVLVFLTLAGAAVVATAGRDSGNERPLTSEHERALRAEYTRGKNDGFRSGLASAQQVAEAGDKAIGKRAASIMFGAFKPQEDAYAIVRFERVRGLTVPWSITEHYKLVPGVEYSYCDDRKRLCRRPDHP